MVVGCGWFGRQELNDVKEASLSCFYTKSGCSFGVRLLLLRLVGSAGGRRVRFERAPDSRSGVGSAVGSCGGSVVSFPPQFGANF